MPHTTHAITKLTLENFRNYRTLLLEVPPGPVVLRGHNGAGKTNILEAISLLSPGRGLRSATLREMDRISVVGDRWPVVDENEISADLLNPNTNHRPPTTPSSWVVAAHVATGDLIAHIGTGRDAEAAIDKRIVKVNGEKIRGQQALAQHTCVQWLTPAMDQVLAEGGTARRKLLDRMVYGFDPEHAARVNGYELSMRERNRLLIERHSADPYWLAVLEQQMAQQAVAITLARLQVVARLQENLAQSITHFPRALIDLNGTIEQWLARGDSALDAETKFAERLAELRAADGARGRATLGPHRSELSVIHREKNMAAEQCSTGEQKALLLSLTLSAACARAAWCGVAPILLLDEVIAHLDVDKRTSLFDLIGGCAIQAWMTGTDAADFRGLEGGATHLEITGGTVQTAVEKW